MNFLIKPAKGGDVMRNVQTLLKEFWQDESGMGVVEIILIMVVLIAMVIIFKEQITKLVNDIWNSINKNAGKVYK